MYTGSFNMVSFVSFAVFFFFLMNEIAEETLKLLFISFTVIYTLFKTHVRFSLRVKIKREIFNLFLKLEDEQKSL